MSLTKRIFARTPFACRRCCSSGLLSGKMSPASKFAQDDHRNFNRHGEAFDRGETFSGLDFETGLSAVEQLKQLVPRGASLAQFALRWILEFPAVTCAIPGAKRPAQVTENIAASDLPPPSDASLKRIGELYEAQIKPLVQHYW